VVEERVDGEMKVEALQKSKQKITSNPIIRLKGIL
jgi:hypothetical protein